MSTGDRSASDHYQTLGVPRTASEKAIRTAFRKRARASHPDLHRDDPEAEGRFKALNTAHEILTDPTKRKWYDRFGDDWERYQQSAKAAGPSFADDPEAFARATSGAGRAGAAGPFGGFGFRFADDPMGATGGGRQGAEEDLFASLFGAAARRQRGPHRGEDIEHPLALTLEEAAAGGTWPLELRLAEPCGACAGTGRAPTGGRCATCGGRGERSQQRRLEVRVPPGVGDGSRIRLAGQGEAGSGGGTPGDLYLRIVLRPHPRFTREGADVHLSLDVPLYTALLGGEVAVSAIGATLALRIPPGTQNGRVFRLAGRGTGAATGGGKGDLLARVNVVLPTELTDEERTLVARLRALREPTDAPTAGAGATGPEA